MGKPKSKKRKSSVQSLTQAGQSFLNKGQYADALSHFRKLWLNEGTQYKAPLIESYLGRIKQLADKSLFEEAALTWESMYNLLKEILYIDLYLSCLLATGKHDKVKKLLDKYPECLADNELKKCIATVIAPYFLTGIDPVVKLFTPLKELSKQKMLILSAIEAYSLGADDKLTSLLNKVSFRSPYKIIALTLKQVVKLEQNSDKEVILWFKNFNNIVYGPLIRCLQLIYNFDLSLLQQLKPLDKKILETGYACRNWSPEKVKVIHQLTRVGEDPEILLDFILAYHDQLNKKEIAQNLAFKLLVQQPKKIPAYERIFGKLSRFNICRIKALHCEASNNIDNALNYWSQCTKELKKGNTVEQSLKLAILLRHITYLEKRYYDDDEYEDSMVTKIEESLIYDIHHKESHYCVINYYKNVDKKKLQKAIDRALEVYPDDFSINMDAGNLAYSQKRFKKALKFSEKALQLEPLNHSAHELLVEIILSDARAHLKKEKAKRAKQIIDSMPENTIQKSHHHILLYVISTMIQMKLNSEVYPYSWFNQDGKQEMPLSIALAVLTESQFIKEPIKLDFKSLKQIPHFKKEDIFCMVELISYYAKINILTAYKMIKPLITIASKISLSLEGANRICDSLKNIKLFDLLEQFSLAYLKQYPGDPFLVFCHIFAKLRGNPGKASRNDSQILARALQQAAARKNGKVAGEIDDFLSRTRFDCGMFRAFDMFNHMPEEMKAILMDLVGN